MPCDPVSEMGDTCGVAFTPSLAWGSKTRGDGWGNKEISSHVSGWERKAPLLYSSFCRIPPSSPTKAPKGSGSRFSPCTLPMTSLGRERPQPGSARQDAAPSSPSTLGGCGYLEPGAGVPPAMAEPHCRLRPRTTPDVWEPDGAAPVAAELPALNNGAIEGLGPGLSSAGPAAG